MSAFDEGRVGLWINNASNFTPRASKIVRFANGMFTDCFLPRSASKAQFDVVRQTFRPDGSMMKAQLYEVATGSVEQFVVQVDADITRLKPGVCELDIEGADLTLAQYIRDTITQLRVLRPTFLFRINVAPFKASWLPFDLLASDPNLYVAIQTYYGDMSRVSESEVLDDLLEHAKSDLIRAKFHPCYGAAGPVKLDGTRGITLPTVFYKGAPAAKLKKGLVFTDDLLSECGLLG